MSIDSATKISKDTKEMTIVNTSGSGHKQTQDTNDIENVRSSDVEIDKATDEVTMVSGILKRNIVCGMKVSVKLHRSVLRAVISKTGTINKIMNILSLREVVASRCGCDLNLKKVTKKAQVGHVKLLTKMTHNKGNILKIIYVKKNKGTSTGGSVNEKSKIMLTGSKTSSGNNQGEVLKPSMRNLLEAIKRTVKMADMTIWNRVDRRWVHVDLLMQLTVKKGILHIKIRDSPPMNRGHRNKSMNCGPMGNRSKDLLVVTTIMLLKTMGTKMRFIPLKRAIRVSLDLIDPLARNQNSRRRVWDKSSNLLGHSKLPLRISNNIMIGGRLKKRNCEA
jgi:hypothetical protein